MSGAHPQADRAAGPSDLSRFASSLGSIPCAGAIYLQFSDCGQHIRRWSWAWFDGSVTFDPRAATVAELRTWAGNMARYPFESATMAEAALLAANAVRGVAANLAQAIEAGTGQTGELNTKGESAVAESDAPSQTS